MIRVLIVDDSATANQVLNDILGGDPEIEVVGNAMNGDEGIRLAKELRPDLITMDIQMPVMDGFQATQEIMIEAPTPIVIISATARAKEVETAMQALRAGALTLILKPAGPAAPEYQRSCREILDTVKAMADVKVVRRRRRSALKPSLPSEVHTTAGDGSEEGYRAIAITASTGGPPALHALLGGLAADFPLPIFVVQHIASGFVEGFAQWLDSIVDLSVKVAKQDELAEPGVVYVAPDDHHMGLTPTGRIRLCDAPEIGGFRPAGTHLFTSLAEAFGNRSIAVILTGMGEDGVEGLRAVHRAGGQIIAQDEASCVIFGMPRAAIMSGLAGTVLPIDRMAQYLIDLLVCKSS